MLVGGQQLPLQGLDIVLESLALFQIALQLCCRRVGRSQLRFQHLKRFLGLRLRLFCLAFQNSDLSPEIICSFLGCGELFANLNGTFFGSAVANFELRGLAVLLSQRL